MVFDDIFAENAPILVKYPSGTCRQASSIAAKDAEAPSATAYKLQEDNMDTMDDKIIIVILIYL